MIALELQARIRRLYYAEHWKIGTIATELGVHPATVALVVGTERLGRAIGLVRPSVLDPYKAFLADVLTQYPRLRATRLHAMLQARGYPGGGVTVRRYVRTIRPAARAEAYLRLQTLPGEQGQVDWGHFGVVQVGHARRPLVCFVLVLSWSRALYARFALDQSLESFLRGHVEAFQALGVPRALLYDNLKSVVLERQGDHVRFHPRLLELAGHYHFAPKPCAPYRGNEKGKVERTIQYLRHSFFAARRFTTLADLNGQLARWITETAHARPVPGDAAGRRVAEALDEERSRLLPLPAHPREGLAPFPPTPGRCARVTQTRASCQSQSCAHTRTVDALQSPRADWASRATHRRVTDARSALRISRLSMNRLTSAKTIRA